MSTLRLLAAALLALSACSPDGDVRIEGVVIDLGGDIATVESFTVRLGDGTDLVFEPAPGIGFHDSAPLTHLRDHLRTGERIEVKYRTLEDGTLVAIEVGDA